MSSCADNLGVTLLKMQRVGLKGKTSGKGKGFPVVKVKMINMVNCVGYIIGALSMQWWMWMTMGKGEDGMAMLHILSIKLIRIVRSRKVMIVMTLSFPAFICFLWAKFVFLQ